MVKRGGGGKGYFQNFRGELAKRGELKNSGGGGVWTLDKAMVQCSAGIP